MPSRVYFGVACIATIIAGLWFYGESRFNAGVRKTTAEFIAADKKGAETVHETATKALAGIGDDTDPDSLLDATNGFRD
ncbi:MAG: hypothetical protein WA790_15825 [Sulfitobacter sp.]